MGGYTYTIFLRRSGFGVERNHSFACSLHLTISDVEAYLAKHVGGRDLIVYPNGTLVYGEDLLAQHQRSIAS